MHAAVFARAARVYRHGDSHAFDLPEVERHYSKEVLAKPHLRTNTRQDGRTALAGEDRLFWMSEVCAASTTPVAYMYLDCLAHGSTAVCVPTGGGQVSCGPSR